MLFIFLLNIEKKYEIEGIRAYFTRRCSQHPAKSPDTSKKAILALCGDPLANY